MANESNPAKFWQAAANKILAGPATGSTAGDIGARSLVAADLPAGAATAVAGIAAGYKLARGQATTVAASDTVVTGLTTVVAVVASLESDPVVGCSFASAAIGDQAGAPAAGSILVKTWKPTTAGAAGNPDVIAATTFTKKVNWVAIGV